MDAKTAQVLLQKATEALRLGRFEQARRFLAEFRAGDPLYALHLQLRGVLSQATGNLDQAAQQFLAALEAGTGTPDFIPGLVQAAASAGVRDERIYAACRAALTEYPDVEVKRLLQPLLEATAFGKHSSFEWNTLVYRTIALPLLQWCLARDHLNEALWLEVRLYAYVKQRETESHFRACFGQWTCAMHAAGERHYQGATRLRNNTGNIRVGLIIENIAGLIHVQGTLKILQGLRATGNRSLQPVLYFFSGTQPNDDERRLLDDFRDLGVPVILLEAEYPETAHKRFDRLLHFARRLAEDRIDVLLWVSLPLMMPLAFGMRIAPVQIWLSMKYHSIESPGIDRYMTRMGFAKTRRVNNRLWDNIPPGQDRWPTDQAHKAAAKPIREGFAGKVILGTYGREEKLVDPGFLSVVARILRENPDAVFLYTGRRNHPAIIQALSTDSRLSDRVHFIGWVDTQLYANVLDIFLDSFPFPCGMTAAEAISVGVPIVMRDTVESRETGLPGHILPVVAGSEGTDEERSKLADLFGGTDLPLFCLARSDEEYISLVSQLIRDRNFRHRAGEAYRQFVEEFFMGAEKMGRAFAEHIENAVKDRAGDE